MVKKIEAEFGSGKKRRFVINVIDVAEIKQECVVEAESLEAAIELALTGDTLEEYETGRDLNSRTLDPDELA